LFVRKKKLSSERAYASLRYGLDWLLVRVGFVRTIMEARQYIRMGVIGLNSKVVTTLGRQFMPSDCFFILFRLIDVYFVSITWRS